MKVTVVNPEGTTPIDLIRRQSPVRGDVFVEPDGSRPVLIVEDMKSSPGENGGLCGVYLDTGMMSSDLTSFVIKRRRASAVELRVTR